MQHKKAGFSFAEFMIVLSIIVLICIAGIAGIISAASAKERKSGGTQTIDLPAGVKLVNASWKDRQMWYLVRPAHSNETAETLEYIEYSNRGLVQGKVIFIEHEMNDSSI